MAADIRRGVVVTLQALYTMFLFTKSDIKTTVIPLTCLAVATAPRPVPPNIPKAAFWIWIHLLQFTTANQLVSPEEDRCNKSDRPIPSKRISLESTFLLRWILVPFCWAWSCWYSVETLYASIAMIALTIMYNELCLCSGYWMVRYAMNAAGFVALEVGGTFVASIDRHHLDRTAVLSVCLSGAIYATTTHTQDFKDVVGDRLVGRRTLPLLYPVLSRYSVLLGLCSWTLVLAHVWDLDYATAVSLMALALYISYRFLALSNVASDQVSFYWYNRFRCPDAPVLFLRDILSRPPHMSGAHSCPRIQEQLTPFIKCTPHPVLHVPSRSGDSLGKRQWANTRES
ncbi:predicted protein [Postia placenta Mad-698-R]|nr:predicted protein [Postia placenta Mad-698-R]